MIALKQRFVQIPDEPPRPRISERASVILQANPGANAHGRTRARHHRIARAPRLYSGDWLPERWRWAWPGSSRASAPVPKLALPSDTVQVRTWVALGRLDA